MSDFQDKVSGATPKPRQAHVSGESHGPDTLRVEYTLTLADAAAFMRYHAKHAPRTKGQRHSLFTGWLLLVFLGLLSVIAVATQFTGKQPSSWSSDTPIIILVFLVYAAIFFFNNKLLERRQLKALRRDPRFFVQRTLAISPEALTGGDQSVALTYQWHAVERIIEQPDHAFFYTSQIEAFILPKRAFADERDFAEFVATARRYHAEARRFVRAEGEA